MINDLTGQRFGNLVVLGDSGQRNKYKSVKWRCLCDCGRECTAMGFQLQHGLKRSCGCYRTQVISAVGKRNASEHTKIFKKSLDSNNTSGYRGVIYSSSHNSYIARITVSRKSYHLWISPDLQECVNIRKEAENALLENRFYEYMEELKIRRKQAKKDRKISKTE